MSAERPPDILDALAKVCRERGAKVAVSALDYQLFIDQDEETMEGLIRLLIINDTDMFLRWGAEVPRTKGNEDVIEMIESQLTLVALGCLRFDADLRMRYFAPEEPEPTDEEMDRIHERIDEALPLIPAALRRLLQSRMPRSDGP